HPLSVRGAPRRPARAGRTRPRGRAFVAAEGPAQSRLRHSPETSSRRRLLRMRRLIDPVHRHRVLVFLADGLLAAAAFALAFQLRFLDIAGGIPARYETMLAGSIVFVALGKALILDLLRQHEQWWR